MGDVADDIVAGVLCEDKQAQIMNNEVMKTWCVIGCGSNLRLTGDFNTRYEAQEWARNHKNKNCVVAEVVYDFRNWEPVSEEHPLTQADNGCAVRVNGLEVGVIDDRVINGSRGVSVKCGGSTCLYGIRSITHVARPPKPPRKTIEWDRIESYSTGKINGKVVATIVVALSVPSGAVATVMHDGKMHHRMLEGWNWDTAAAMNWCERVVNGDVAT